MFMSSRGPRADPSCLMEDYAVEDHADNVLAIFKMRKEAID